MSDTKPCILIIDDEEVTRETLAAILANFQYHLEFATSGEQGLSKAHVVQPDVILLDLMLPGVDGYEVCRLIRSSVRLAEVPVIMITALDDRMARLTGLQAGADDFLTKPFDSLELKVRISTLIRVGRYRRLQEEREKLAATLRELSAKNQQLKELSWQILETQELERRRLAADLHDEIGQTLTGLKLTLEMKDKSEADAQSTRERALGIVQGLLQRVREISLDLRPAMLDDLGLYAALDWLFKRYTESTGIRVQHNINAQDERRLPRSMETALFRVTQEALTNVARHTEAREVTVTLAHEGDRLQLTVVDQGAGFNLDVLQSGRSTGLSGMRERMALVNGNFRLQSAPGEGTVVTVDLPLTQ